jgi:hypothetical protein
MKLGEELFEEVLIIQLKNLYQFSFQNNEDQDM